MLNDSYAIRDATLADLSLLTDIELEAATRFSELAFPPIDVDRCLPATFLREAILERRVWVACHDGGDVVGFALAMELDGAAHLLEIDVVPDHGRRGVGQALIARVEAWGRANDLASITLTTFRDVPWNGPYYRRLGFQELAPGDQSPAIREILDTEQGLVKGGWVRVAMVRPISPPAP